MADSGSGVALAGSGKTKAADLKSVRACADGLNEKADLFDLIIAYAGVMATPFGHSPTASRRSSAPTISAISCS